MPTENYSKSAPCSTLSPSILNVEVLSTTGEEIEMRELDEDVFRTAEELGIDISRPERGSDEEDERRASERGGF